MMLKRKNGFTLLELIMVIVLLAILAVIALAKYNDLTETARKAKVKANAAALKSGAQLAHTKWLALGSPTSLSARNDIQIYGHQPTGKIDVNIYGWPAQSWLGVDSVLHTNNDADCLSLWRALISDGTSKSAINNSAEFIVNYEGDQTCSYKLTKKITYGFIYDSKTGEVNLTF